MSIPLPFVLLLLIIITFEPAIAQPDVSPQWTTSRLQGSPEPPLPCTWQQIHPELKITGGISLHRVPDSTSYWVLEHNGKVISFDDSLPHTQQSLVADFNAALPPSAAYSRGITGGARGFALLYSAVFDPNFAKNRYVYFAFSVSHENATKTHISRFIADGPLDRMTVNLSSELNILLCDGGGHNGCTLLFDREGMLFISLGDLGDANPPDGKNTGQNISDLYASILKIDVRNATAEQPYVVPQDNPFVNVERAAPEVYAYGLRNPFRMCFHPGNGELWVGDVGWETWELIIRVAKGGNYGWSLREGTSDVKAGVTGPTPILPPTIQLPHSIAASITGGMFYQGTLIPQLRGTYVFGDWVTRKYWSIDPTKPDELRDVTESTVKPICFEIDDQGELLVLEHNEAHRPSGIYRLVANPEAQQARTAFPTKLSETGLFADTASHELASGVQRYQINETMWVNGASPEFFVAIPHGGSATMYQTPVAMFNWYMTTVQFPAGSVLGKTYHLKTLESAMPRDRIETQLAVKDKRGDWQYYTYRWNESGTDADLIAKEGTTDRFWIADDFVPEGRREISWSFAARTQCKICHTPWLGETIGFIEPQLRRPRESHDDWRRLIEMQTIDVGEQVPTMDAHYQGLVSSDADSESLDRRARAYLHANCSHCHIRGGNASTAIDLRFEKTLQQTEAVSSTPMRGSMSVEGAKIIAPGDVARSVLWLRMAKSGSGHMPQIGTDGIDYAGVRLIGQWIQNMPQDAEIRHALDLLNTSSAANISDDDRLDAASELSSRPEGVIHLANALANRSVVPWLRERVVAATLDQAGIHREMLEPYAKSEDRLRRLGSNFDNSAVLLIDGHQDRGRELFRSGVGTCSACHQLEGVGNAYAPALDRLSNSTWRATDVLHQIRQPSLMIHSDFQTTVILTESGQVYAGLLVVADSNSVQIRDASGKLHQIVVDDIEERKTAPQSMMPEGLLDNLTAQQAADLLAYVMGLQSRDD